MGKSYKDAGVDKEEGYRSVSLMRGYAKETSNVRVLGGLGSFASLYALPPMEEPVLVSGTDGVGTKLEIALRYRDFESVGMDCFAMCANDVLCHGAKPLFFLDYIACGKLEAETAAEIVRGISYACKDTGCSLVGGETAEMPGFYKEGDYDVAGFCVGVVERKNIIEPSRVREGDLVLGLASSGVHSNGFSLIRSILTNMDRDFGGRPLYNTLLTPTRVYVNPILDLLNKTDIHGMAHITGGGIPENLPRAVPDGLCAVVDKASIEPPQIFKFLQDQGVEEEEMWNTFNMGVGFVLIIDPSDFDTAESVIKRWEQKVFKLGKVVRPDTPGNGAKGKKFCFA